MQMQMPEPNYWWLLWIAIAGGISTPLFLWIKEALSKNKKKKKGKK